MNQRILCDDIYVPYQSASKILSLLDSVSVYMFTFQKKSILFPDGNECTTGSRQWTTKDIRRNALYSLFLAIIHGPSTQRHHHNHHHCISICHTHIHTRCRIYDINEGGEKLFELATSFFFYHFSFVFSCSLVLSGHSSERKRVGQWERTQNSQETTLHCVFANRI